jgi:hypothetical protein
VASAFDGSDEEMRRLRFPFEATRAGDAEQDQEVPLDDE